MKTMKCIKCNNTVLDSSKFCPYCGTSIEHVDTVRNIEELTKPRINRKVITLVSIIALFITIIAVLINNSNKKPNEKIIKDLIPDYITSYELDGVWYTSDVKSVEVEKGKEQVYGYDAYCKITLEDGNMTRIHYSILSFEKIGNDWHLCGYQEYQDEEITKIKQGPDLNIIKDMKGMRGSKSIDSVEQSEGNNFSYTVSVSEEGNIFSSSGLAKVSGSLAKYDDSEYTWVLNTDFSGINYDFRYLIGSWYADDFLGSYIDDVRLIIENVDTTNHQISWSCEGIKHSWGEDTVYRNAGTSTYDFDGATISFYFEFKTDEHQNPLRFAVDFNNYSLIDWCHIYMTGDNAGIFSGFHYFEKE